MKRIFSITSIIGIIFTFTSFAFGEENTFLFSKRYYYEFLFSYNTISSLPSQNDFSGDKEIAANDEINNIPKIEGGNGWGVLLGTTLDNKDRFSLDISYLQSNHITTFSPRFYPDTESAVYRKVNTDLKYNLMPGKDQQMFVLFGLNMPYISLRRASSSSSINYTDAELLGYGINAGIGINSYINSKIVFTLGITYYIENYFYLKGAMNKFRSITNDNFDSSDNGLQSHGINMTFGIKYNFY